MPEPVDFQIVEAVQAALQDITVAGGYYHDVAPEHVRLDLDHAVEELLRPEGPSTFIALEVQPDDEWDYEKSDQVVAQVILSVHWIGTADLSSDGCRARTYFRGCADVERALNVDLTLSGLATDVRILRRDPTYSETGSRVWAEVAIAVRHHRAYGAP